METVIKRKNVVVLTERDLQIVSMLSIGKTAPDIAKKLKMSERTIEGIIVKLRGKYKCKNVVHLVSHFLRNQILP